MIRYIWKNEKSFKIQKDEQLKESLAKREISGGVIFFKLFLK